MPGEARSVKGNAIIFKVLVVVFGALTLFMAAFHFGASDTAEVKDSLKTHVASSDLCDKEHDGRIRTLEVDSAGTNVKLDNIKSLLVQMNQELKEMRKEIRDR